MPRTPKERFLRCPEVEHRTGIPKASIYAKIAAGTFPRSIRIGGKSSSRIVAWRETEIDAWIRETIAEAERQRQREPDPEAEAA